MIVKAKKSNKTYKLSKNQACKKCLGQRVVYISNYREYLVKDKLEKRDLGYWEPCKCIKKICKNT